MVLHSVTSFRLMLVAPSRRVNGQPRQEELARTRRVLPASWALPELIEAAARTGDTAREQLRARDGLSNPDIGARLFISSRTVRYQPEQGLRLARHYLSRSAPPRSDRRPGRARSLASLASARPGVVLEVGENHGSF
jgi:hypothetical protein